MMHPRSVRSLMIAFGLLALAACAPRPPESAFLPRGGPESLLDVSSEVVNLNIGQPGDRTQLARWVEKDQPTRAELYCMNGDLSCAAAQRTLQQHGVATTVVPSSNNTVSLVYERILAHDCNPRYYEDDSATTYNTNHPSYGCATAANTVQMVSNKQQFVNPALSDNPPALGAVSAYGRAYTPKPVKQSNYNASTSAVQSLNQD